MPMLRRAPDIWASRWFSHMPQYQAPGVGEKLFLRPFRWDIPYSVVPQVNCKAAALQGQNVSARAKNLWGSPPRIGQGRTHWVLKEAISAEDHVVIIDDIVRTEGLKMFKHV